MKLCVLPIYTLYERQEHTCITSHERWCDMHMLCMYTLGTKGLVTLAYIKLNARVRLGPIKRGKGKSQEFWTIADPRQTGSCLFRGSTASSKEYFNIFPLLNSSKYSSSSQLYFHEID